VGIFKPAIKVADILSCLRAAAKAVVVEYEELAGAVFSCEEAIAAESFIEVSVVHFSCPPPPALAKQYQEDVGTPPPCKFP